MPPLQSMLSVISNPNSSGAMSLLSPRTRWTSLEYEVESPPLLLKKTSTVTANKSTVNDKGSSSKSGKVAVPRRKSSPPQSDDNHRRPRIFEPITKLLSRQMQKRVRTVKIKEMAKNLHDLALTHLVDLLFIPSDEEVLGLQGNFAPVQEIGEKVPVQVIQGEVPKDFPPGCYVRNGPNPRFGLQQNLVSPFCGGKTLYSWFEGEGMLHAVYFERDGSIWYKNKYVETDSFKQETEMARQMYLPTMDEQSTPGVRFNRMLNIIRNGKPQRNLGNTSIFEHAGHVVAAVEGGNAYEIDLSDLSTLGEYTCDGQWDRRFFGPHPKKRPDTQQMVVYGFDIHKPYYIMGVLSADGKTFLNKLDLGMDRLVLMHDIGITEKYIIVYDFPVVMDVYNMLMKGTPILSMESTAYARIGVIPLMGDQQSIKWFDVDTCFITHHCNSYEDGDEIVVNAINTRLLQLVALPPYKDKFEWYARGMTLDHLNNYETKDASIDGLLYEHLHEWRLNLKTGVVVQRSITQKKFPLELPRINESYLGKKYRYCYASSEDIEASKASGYPRYGRLVKVDVSQNNDHKFHEVGENVFASEAVFIPKPGSTEEDDGWIVTYVHNESTNLSDMIIIDAQNFEKEPLARIRLPQRVPYGFHGAYIPYK